MVDLDGEAAIEKALRAAYPAAEPVRFDAPAPGKRDLVGCVAVRVDEPVPHWLVVSRGFTELKDKIEETADVSGWGFELTCRLPVRSPECDFELVMRWMQAVADQLADKITMLEAYSHMAIRQAKDEDEIAALVFIDDLELAPARSRNGAFVFLQMVGLTSTEYEALEAWDPAALVSLIHARDPLFVMDVERRSYLRDPMFSRAVEEGRERDGSSTGVLYGLAIVWFEQAGELQIYLDAGAARALRASVKARLTHGNPMLFFGDPQKRSLPDGALALRFQVNLALQPEDGPSEITEIDGHKVAVIRLNARAVSELASVLEERPGSYVLPALPRVRFIVTTGERLRELRHPW